MSEFDFLAKSRKLLRQLNWYLFHVICYLIANISLVVFIYRDASSRWPLFLIILLWTCAVIYHGLKINNIDLLKGRKKHMVIKGIIKIGGGY